MQTLRAGRPFQRVVNSSQASHPWQSVTLTLLVKHPGVQVVNVRLKLTFSPGFSSLSLHTAWLPCHCCAISCNDRSCAWSNICDDHICQRLIAWVSDSDLVISIFADLLLFRAYLMQFNAAFAYACAPLAGSGICIAGCYNSCVAYFSSLYSCEADVDFLCLARLKAAKFVSQRSQAAAVFQAIWHVVCDNNIFSCAASAVGNCDSVMYAIAWAYFFRSAFFASQHRFSAKQRAESYRNGCGAEAGALFSFAFAFYPYFGWAAFAFSHGADIPYDACGLPL